MERAYNGFVVVVRAVAPTPGKFTRTALVAISPTDKEEPVTSLYSTVEFPANEDAEAYGVKMAEEWIQSRYQVSDKRERKQVENN
jgi:pyruvoyl-dependent arginine decarboxylase (PvlArgDC)